MRKKKLPIGIQTFSEIITENYCYVDKTGIAYDLIDSGKYYFLSRPRRFGKSLFLDTLAEIFQGRKEFFEGLAIYDQWDWDTKYPVIKISFGSGNYGSDQAIQRRILRILEENKENLQISTGEYPDEEYGEHFSAVIRSTFRKYQQKVVLLIDEYDKPILDNISDRETALAARTILRNFYAVIKDSDPYLKFVFLTGVSKFSKMNLFSGLNNIEDITLRKKYATITGYTQKDLEEVFSDYLDGVDLTEVKRWYNGYNYFGEAIYNPFDILLFFSNDGKFENYWWESGNPSFLIEKLKTGNYYLPDLENIVVDKTILNSFDIEHIDLVALLWQTGYLTFDREMEELDSSLYQMKIPNLEIQKSLNALFVDYLTSSGAQKVRTRMNLMLAVQKHDFAALETHLRSLFASIPYTNYANNIIAEYEGYYASVVYCFLAGLGFDIVPEEVTCRGRADLTLKLADAVVIVEFKTDAPEEAAIQQIKERKYYEKYQAECVEEKKPIYLVGINFDSEKRNLAEFVWETV